MLLPSLKSFAMRDWIVLEPLDVLLWKNCSSESLPLTGANLLERCYFAEEGATPPVSGWLYEALGLRSDRTRGMHDRSKEAGSSCRHARMPVSRWTRRKASGRV